MIAAENFRAKLCDVCNKLLFQRADGRKERGGGPALTAQPSSRNNTRRKPHQLYSESQKLDWEPETHAMVWALRTDRLLTTPQLAILDRPRKIYEPFVFCDYH